MTTNAVKYDRGSPTIVISNTSKHVDVKKLKRAIRAIQKQVDEHFFPLWGWRAKLLFQPKRPPKDAMHITIKNREKGALDGYHFIEDTGLPETYVFVLGKDGKPVDFYPTLSHEVLEMIVDPGVNLFADGYFAYRGHRVRGFVAYEVCDPVQECFYEIDGIKVSDFVVPEWFEPERLPDSMKFSFKNNVNAPFKLAPNGYLDAVRNKRMITVWGETANKKKKRHRLKARKLRGKVG
jgi:hypothetical protein